MWTSYIETLGIGISSLLQRQCDIFEIMPREPSKDKLEMVPYAVDSFYTDNPPPANLVKKSYMNRFRLFDEETVRIFGSPIPSIEYDEGDSRADCSASDEDTSKRSTTFSKKGDFNFKFIRKLFSEK